MLIHTGERPCRCDQCSEVLKDRGELNKHVTSVIKHF
jgi:Zn-finger nucleic acid-binding protein